MNDFGDSALLFAAQSNHHTIATIILKSGTLSRSINAVSTSQSNYQTVLMAASASGHFDIVSKMMPILTEENVG